MSDERDIGPQARDDELTRALRALYLPPVEEGYWTGLEARVLARIDAQEPEWTRAFSGWVRQGLLAAATALFAIAVGLYWARAVDDAPDAYDMVVEVPRTLSQQLATETTGLPAGEAALRFVIAP